MQSMHLFAGAGGGLLADLILGHTPVVAVEHDKYCCRVLRERAAEGWFPDLHVYEGDIRLFDPSEYAGRVDLIAAGFPCQDISHAGNRAGIQEGTRSGLWSEVVRIARAVRPSVLFLENVAAIVNLRPGLDVVLADLADLGFDARWICLRASDAGAPHRRDRWWCLADADRKPATGSINRRGAQRSEAAAPEGAVVVGDAGSGGACPRQSDVADAERERGCSRETDWEDASDAWQSPGDSFVGYWDVEPDVGRVANGVASRVDRLKAIGNGQVPIQAALAWRILGGEIAL